MKKKFILWVFAVIVAAGFIAAITNAMGLW